MAIAHHLENLRGKPEHVRRRIAFWTSLGTTALIFTFWLGSFTTPGAASAKLASSQQGSLTASVANVRSPGQSLIAGLGAFGTDIWQLIFGTKKVTYSEVQVAPGKN